MAEELLELEDELDNGEGSEELYERVNIVVDKGQEPLRIDKFLMNRMEGATVNKIQQAHDAAMVLVNEKAGQAQLQGKAGRPHRCIFQQKPRKHRSCARKPPVEYRV